MPGRVPAPGNAHSGGEVTPLSSAVPAVMGCPSRVPQECLSRLFSVWLLFEVWLSGDV